MKQHLETIARANRAISDAEARAARVTPEEERYRAEHAAASERAAELRARVQSAMALAAIGEGADAQDLLGQAEASERRAADLRETLAGLAKIKSTAEAAAAAARAERMRAVTAALDEHAQSVVADYEKAAVALMQMTRRAHAIEAIRATMGDRRAVLSRRDAVIPAPVGTALPVTGQYNDMLYSSWLELLHPSSNAQGAATEAELEVLAKAGLEV
jgi:DNA repair exonuclease SbcCD ATPase subunit